jgi:hypothetical protein
MIDAVLRYDGYIVQSTGDGIFALFSAAGVSFDLRRPMLRSEGGTFGRFVAITRTHGGISDGNHFNRWMRLRRDPL